MKKAITNILRTSSTKVFQHNQSGYLILALWSILAFTINSCEEEETVPPTTIEFNRTEQFVTEGGEAAIKIDFSKGALKDGVLTLGVQSSAIYGDDYTSDPPVDNFTIQIPIAKGQSTASILIKSIDNDVYTGIKFIKLSILPLDANLKAGLKKTITLTINDDEGPSVAAFEFSSLMINEEGTAASIKISLSAPAKGAGSLTIQLFSDSPNYKERFSIDPQVVNNGITLDFQPGETEKELKVTPINNNTYDGDTKIDFKFLEESGVIKVGFIKSLLLTIADDEKPSKASFVTEQSTLDEGDSQGRKVEIEFDNPAKGTGTLTIGINSGTGIYGKHFTTDPPAIGNSIQLAVAENETSKSFTVFPVDELEITGKYDIFFSMIASSGVVLKSAPSVHKLTRLDNDISVINFKTNGAFVEENVAEWHEIELTFSKPPPALNKLVIEVVGYSERFKSEPAVEEVCCAGGYYSSYPYYVISLNIQTAQTSVKFKVMPIDDEQCNGANSPVQFKLLSTESGGIEIGDKNSYNLVLIEDDIKSILTLSETAVVLSENSSEGKTITMTLSPSRSTLSAVRVNPTNYQKGRYTTIPEMKSNQYGGYETVTSFEENTSTTTFKILPTNDALTNGNLFETFHVVPTDNTGCITIPFSDIQLIIVDDD